MRTTKRYLLAVVAVMTMFGALSVLPAAAAPPVKNDTPSTAVAVRRLPYSKTVNMTNANNTSGPAFDSTFGCVGNFTSVPEDVWFTYTPATSQSVTADTGGSDIRGDLDADYYDTLLAVYTYDGTTWTLVTCDDDGYGTGNWSKLTIAVTAGTTYYFRAGTYGGQGFNDPSTPILKFNLAVTPA